MTTESGYQVELARTLEELERLRPAWDELPWQREEAAYEYFAVSYTHLTLPTN